MAYTKVYKDFKGVDLSSEPSEVDDRRFAHAINVWRDYHNENGEAVETAPGFRVLGRTDPTRLFSLYYFPGDTPRLIASTTTRANAFEITEKNGVVSLGRAHCGNWLSGTKRASVFHYGKLYIADRWQYRVVYEKDGDLEIDSVGDSPYIPTTFSSGKPYEQRNLLTDKFVVKYTVSQEDNECVIFDPCTAISKITLNGTEVKLFSLTDYSEWNEAATDVKVVTDDGTVLYERKDREVVTENTKTTSAVDIGFSNTDIDFNNTSELSLPAELLYATRTRWGTDIDVVPYIRVTQEDGTVQYCAVSWKHSSRETELPSTEVVMSDIVDGKRYIHSIAFSGFHENMELVEVVFEGMADPQRFYTVGEKKDALSGAPDFQTNRPSTAAEAIHGCTLIEEFDGKLFLSGNPKYPNTIFYTHRRSDTGVNDPTYIGAYNYINDGTGTTPITAMISTPTNLIVFKDDVAQGSSVYYHQAQYSPSTDSTTANLQPRVYPKEVGVPGVGCVGCAVNFLDDPVFLSTRGLEAVGKSQVNLERTLAHRSYYVDAKLINEDLRNAQFAEWDGYLCILVPGGRMYLADSRQIDSSIHGHRQYEWYLWDGIGVHSNKVRRYRYATVLPAGIGDGQKYNGIDIVVDGSGGYVKADLPEPITIKLEGVAVDVVLEEREGVPYYFVVEWYGEMRLTEESVFYEATSLISIGDRLYFGCKDGSICVFNTDERDETRKIVSSGYIRERESDGSGLGYLAEMATKFDHCGRTNVAKSTEKGTFVFKVKAYPTSKITVKVRTDKDEKVVYDGAISQSNLSELDFASFSFNTSSSFLLAIRERERKWVEKQILVQSWCYGSPFGLISATYDFTVAGKVKLR